MNKLAIIIPAYKIDYLKYSLESLVNQTDKRFKVYIGDDCSPDDLFSVVTKYQEKLEIQYLRFQQNIGSDYLVDQWKRCIEMSKLEEWIWLFSDDDIADFTCVANFYDCLEKDKGKFDVYRFNTVVIDKDGNIIGDNPVGPEIETSEQMAYHLLLGNRGNSMPDHIFSRKIYNKTDGIVSTNYAQGADWATSIKFSKDNGIKIIPDAKLFWRHSGINITSIAYKNKVKISLGYFEFLAWLIDHFQYLKHQKAGEINFTNISNASLINLKLVISNHYKGLNLIMFIRLFKLLTKTYKMSYFQALKFILNFNAHAVSIE